MAFTDAQKVEIRMYLGYPQLNRYRDTRLEAALDVVGADPEASAKAIEILSKLAAVELELDGSVGTAGLKRAEEVEWYPNQGGFSSQIEAQGGAGRRHASRLSQLFGVPLWGDAFGTLGYPGDEFMGRAHQYGNGGMFPLG